MHILQKIIWKLNGFINKYIVPTTTMVHFPYYFLSLMISLIISLFLLKSYPKFISSITICTDIWSFADNKTNKYIYHTWIDFTEDFLKKEIEFCYLEICFININLRNNTSINFIEIWQVYELDFFQQRLICD